MIRRAANMIAHGTMWFFSHPLTVMVTMLMSAGSILWAALWPSELAWTLFLSILAIAIESVILFSNSQDRSPS